MNQEEQAPQDDHEIYLVVADATEGFQLALRYVARLAEDNGAKVAILYVMSEEDFQHWGKIEKQIQDEQREETENLLLSAAEKVYELNGLIPVIYLEEGGRLEAIVDVINNDHHIKKLILGAEAQSSNPGPLVTYFTGKGLSNLRVPLTIVPGDLTPEAIDDLI